jgi:ABC-type multidrug transport system ATPase subunit
VFVGLDVSAASKVMTELQREAVQQGMIVIFTTRQPSIMIRERFNQMMLLSKGRPAFVGATNSVSDHFASIGYPCPLAWTPPEYYLALLCPRVSDKMTIEKLLSHWQESGVSALEADIIESLKSTDDGAEFVGEPQLSI